MANYYIHPFNIDHIGNTIVDQLVAQYEFTLIDYSTALLNDKTVVNTDLADKIYQHTQSVIQGEVEGTGELPLDLFLETIQRKLTLDESFKRLLFYMHPFKADAIQKVDMLLSQLNQAATIMFLLMPYENEVVLDKKMKEIEADESLDDVKDFDLICLPVDYDNLAPLIDYFKQHNRLNIINTTNKTHEEIFKEICQVIDNI